MLSLLTHIKIIDFSHNAIMKIEDNALVGVNTSYLDLGFNSLRSIPTLSLRKLTAATTIVLDGNLFTVLETGSIYRQDNKPHIKVFQGHLYYKIFTQFLYGYKLPDKNMLIFNYIYKLMSVINWREKFSV